MTPRSSRSLAFPRVRRVIASLPSAIVVAALAGATGCATVTPQADYQRTIEQIRDRTAVHDIYDPETAAQVEEKVVALLQDALTVEEAVTVALLNNRRFQSLFEGIGVSRADVVQSGLLSNPSLGLSIRFPEGGGRSNFTFGFAQQVVDLWQIPVRKEIAEAELERTVLGVVDEALSLTARVKSDYFRLAELLRVEELTGENLELVETLLKLAQTRFEAGEVGQVDVNLARGDMINAQADAMTVARDRELAQIALARDLGLSQDNTPTLLGAPLEADAPDFPSGSLVGLAMRNRVDAQAAASVVRGAEAEIKKQYRSIFPSITVGLEGERPESRALPGQDVIGDTARASVAAGSLTAPSIQSRAERDQERRQIIDFLLGPTLDITLPLWDQNQAQIAKATFAANQRRKEFEDLLDSIAGEVNEALAKREAAERLAEFYRTEAVPHAKTTVEAARSAYSAGEETVLVLIQAQQTLKTQQRAQVAAMRDFAQANAELERAIGGRVPAEPASDAQHLDDSDQPAGDTDEPH